MINLGFWPGGDRDGNPFVTTKITLNVAERLRQTILRSYYRDIRRLKRRFTFDGVQNSLSESVLGFIEGVEVKGNCGS